MSDMYRVSAETADGRPLVLELFRAESDAKRFMEDLTESDDSILAAAGAGPSVAVYEEMHNGQWTVVTRKLVIP